jgi:hypothetical protein
MRNIIRNFSNKCLSLAYMGEEWVNSLLQSIIEAGRTISYVETLNPSKADKLHLSIKGSDRRLFMREFEKEVRFAIAKLKLKKVKIAFDTTEDLTWMKDDFNLRPSAYEKHLPAWKYLNVSIVEPCFLPLMSVPYRQIDDLDNLVIDLLSYIRTLPIIVDLALFDRGFYHGHLIDYLNGKRRGWSWPYLMLVPENKKIKRYIGETENIRYFTYQFKYSKDKSKWKPSTTIIVKRIDEKTCWCYATNQKPSLLLIREYKKRWNIETGFRVHDEARIKSKSKNPLIRFFYHLLGMLLIILWRLQNTIRYYVFKRYLKYMEYQFYPDYIKEVLHPP